MDLQIYELKKAMKKELDKNRYEHTLGVMYTAGCLAMAYDYDIERAQLAGLLHDCAKCIPNDEKIKLCGKHHIELTQLEKKNPFLIHAKLGAFMAENIYGIHDEAILHAIKVHTTGVPGMNLLDKILFVADYIEPQREKAVHLKQIRKTAFMNLNLALEMILHDTISYLNETKNDKNIDPLTLETYQYYTGGIE